MQRIEPMIQTLDENFEEFQAKAQVYWCDVRGKRYPVHQLAHLEDLFLPTY